MNSLDPRRPGLAEQPRQTVEPIKEANIVDELLTLSVSVRSKESERES